MKINRLELLRKMEVAAKVRPSTTPMEILKWVKLAFDGTSLSVTATDNEVGVRLLIPGGIEGEPLTVVVPADQTVRALRELSSELIDLEWAGGATASIRSDGDTVEVNAWGNVDEFPVWKHEGVEYIVSPADLLAAVQRCTYAADRENGSYAIKSIHFLIGGGNLVVQATNCAKAAFEPVSCVGDPRSVLIPPKAMSLVSSGLGKDFTLCVGDDSVEFRTPCDVVYSRQVSGKFPNFDRITSYGNDDKRDPVNVTVGDLSKFFRKAMLATDTESVRVEVELKDQILRATSRSQDKGATDIVMSIDSNESCKVALWGQYVKEMLSSLKDSETLSWEMAPHHANTFKVGNWTGVLMPLAREE